MAYNYYGIDEGDEMNQDRFKIGGFMKLKEYLKDTSTQHAIFGVIMFLLILLFNIIVWVVTS